MGVLRRLHSALYLEVPRPSALLSSFLLPSPIPYCQDCSVFPLSPSLASRISHPPTDRAVKATQSSSCTLHEEAEESPFLAFVVLELRGDGHGPVVACGVDDGRLGKQGTALSGRCMWSLLLVVLVVFKKTTYLRATHTRHSPRHARGIATSSSGGLVAFHTSIGPSRHVPGSLKTARNG